jgi:glucose/arabinose dehydrogenase
MTGLGLVVLAIAAGLVLFAQLDPDGLRSRLVLLMSPSYAAPDPDATPIAPGTDPAAAELGEAIAVELAPIAKGLPQITDVAFVAGKQGELQALVALKTGSVRWLKVATGMHGKLFELPVLTASEQGLLGLALHPKDPTRLFVSSVGERDGKDLSRIEEHRISDPSDLTRAKVTRVRLVLELEQPYANHDGGQIVFGPDGMLYVGFGDGGYRDDPRAHGQNGKTWLGSMLRIDVNDAGAAYRVPSDNPFVGNPEFAPETYAYGLRNPWRFSFDPAGRLIVADVGQDAFEEIDIVQAGDNLGWNVREGFACAQKKMSCQSEGLVPPVLVYGRNLGVSVTGGFVYTGSKIEKLRGHYVFGDFASGRLFAMRLPEDRSTRVERPASLGKHPILISTFARDPSGELYVADFGHGMLYKLQPG